MARGKGQVRSIKKNAGGVSMTDLGSIFNQLLGDEKSLDPDVVMEKYNKLKSNIETIKKILQKFSDVILLPKFSDNNKILGSINEIKNFIESCGDLLSLEVTTTSVIHVYRTIKESDIITKLLVTCKKLLSHSKSLDDIDNLSEKFIHNEPGISLELFSFSKLNFKTLFNSQHMNNDNKKYVLIVLSMIFTKSYDTYNLVTSPDIDIDKFSKIIIDSIQEAKKSIPRCDKAFRKIAHSVDLLKNNFNGYYKDFIVTKSPSIIIENFVLDVSKDLDSDAETTRQFKRIVMHYQKKFNESGKNKDPRLSQMFDTIHDKFKILETHNEEGCDDDEEEGDVSDVVE
jgi:hypothetical protein